MNLWKNWDENEKAAAVRIAGLCMAALTVFCFTSSVSYLLHWKNDMSLQDITNAGGTVGNKFGRLLVCEMFGLGSFFLPVIFGAISIRLLIGRWRRSLLKTGMVAVFGAFFASLAFAYTGRLLGFEAAFGGGLGGRCGDFIVRWSDSLFGVMMTGFFIVILIVCFLFFSSASFTRWFSQLGNHRNKHGEEELKGIEDPDIPGTCKDGTRKNGTDDILDDEDWTDRDLNGAVPGVGDEIGGDETGGDKTGGDKIGGDEIGGDETGPDETEAGKTEVNVTGGANGSLNVNQGFEIIQDGTLGAEVKELPPIDNRLEAPDGLPGYSFPSIDLLENYSSGRREVTTEELTRNTNKIRATLANYKIQVVNVRAVVGPTVTLYKVYPAPGVKIADIKKLQEDIALSLSAKGVRVITLSDSVGIEVANDYSSIVPLKSLLNDRSFRDSKADLPVAIGYTITQEVKVFDLADAPHLLIAGATKQGKSVGLNVIVASLLYRMHPSELRFVFIDPKMVEFSAYGQLLYHYMAVLPDAVSEEDQKQNAIVKKPKDAEKILRSLCIEMDDRYELLSKAGVNNIKLYNSKYKQRHLRPDHGHRFLPYLVVVVDEYADLTMTTGASPEARAASRSITNSIIRLAQKGRAAGLHVILATQRPSVDVISGIIKSNFPMRIAFRVASRVDSMTILDAPGAEKLIGKGDMLFSAGIESERIQCAYISGEEIERITGFIGSQNKYGQHYNTPYYLPSAEEAGSESGEGGGMVDMHSLDERFEEAAKMVVTSQRGSTSDLQRKLGMGYAKAGRVMDQLEAAGIVGPQEGSKPRQVLVPDLNTLQPILDAFIK